MSSKPFDADKTRASTIRSRIQALGLEQFENQDESNKNTKNTTEVKRAPKLPPPRRQPPSAPSTEQSGTNDSSPKRPTSFHEVQSKIQSEIPANSTSQQKSEESVYSNVTQKRPMNRPDPLPKGVATTKPTIPPRPQPRNPSLARIPLTQNSGSHASLQLNRSVDVADERIRPVSVSMGLARIGSNVGGEVEPDSVKGSGDFVTYQAKVEEKKVDKQQQQPVTSTTDAVLDEQFRNKYKQPTKEQEKAAILLQKYIKRWLARKKLKSMKSRKLHREKCAAEILSTEKYYVECLRGLSDVYLEPLKKLASGPRPPITREQISQVFSDIEVIINVNSAFLEGLDKKLKDYTAKTVISDVFLDMAPFFKTYTRYCNNYDKSSNVLKEIKQHPELKVILAGMDKDPRTTKLGLASYLILPIQRIPRYRLLLTELIKQTEKEHPDYDQLNLALVKICEVADHLNTAMKGIDATNEIIKIQNMFTSEVSFIEPHRRFLSSGRLTELKETDKASFGGRDIYLHLFNDIIVFSYPTNSGEYTYKGELQLCNAILLDYVRSDATPDTIFEVKSPSYQCILRAPSIEEKNKWLNNLDKAITESKSLRKNNNLNVTVDAVADETASTLFVAKTGDLEDFELTPEECVQLMKQGATMLKYGRTGKPHFRTIVLSKNERMLLWSSPNKTSHESKVALTDVSKMEKGQKTSVFAKYKNPDHEPLSFSLLYKNRTLDLVCKDKKEYMIWITGIQYLLSNIVMGRVPNAAVDDTNENVVVLSHDLSKERQKFKEMFERIGDAYTWGQGTRGALGHGDQQDQTVPLVMKDFLYLDVSFVACENSASAALMLTGELFTWGSGEKGRLGHGDTADRVKPALVKELHGHKIMKVSMGALHTLALDENGHIWAFGSSEHGQLGLGTDFIGPNAVQSTPRLIPALKSARVRDIACGHHHSACITLEGVVMIWGRGEDGQLGMGNKDNVPIPTVIPRLQSVRAAGLALGLWHSIVLSSTGQLYSFGNATYGQLGHGNTDEVNEPKQISYFENKNVINVSAGSAHSACIIDNGEIFCWGSGIYGQIGNNEKAHAYIPTLVKSLRGDAGKEIVCGVNHVLALMESGKVYAWGAGTYGRLGLKSENDQHLPKEIQFLADKSVRTLAAGGSQSACVCAHQWVPDKDAVACMGCKSTFTFLKRRHHCRYCGGIFCGSCTTKRKAILRFGFDDPVRVCDYCYSILSNSGN